MRPDLEIAERHMSPGLKRFFHRWSWVIQLSSAIFFLVASVGGFIQLIGINPIVAIAWTLFGWAAAWLSFTLALRTRARRSRDYPSDM